MSVYAIYKLFLATGIISQIVSRAQALDDLPDTAMPTTTLMSASGDTFVSSLPDIPYTLPAPIYTLDLDPELESAIASATAASGSPSGACPFVSASANFAISSEIESIPSSTSAAPQETGPIDATTIIGDPDKESEYCVQECVAAFKGCVSTDNTEEIGSIAGMDCHAAAACYCTDPPYQISESSVEPGSGPANPQDPASDPALLSSRIDMDKAHELCINTCQSIEAGDAQKTAPNSATFGIDVEVIPGTFNLTDSWNCIKTAQNTGAPTSALCTIS